MVKAQKAQHLIVSSLLVEDRLKSCKSSKIGNQCARHWPLTHYCCYWHSKSGCSSSVRLAVQKSFNGGRGCRGTYIPRQPLSTGNPPWRAETSGEGKIWQPGQSDRPLDSRRVGGAAEIEKDGLKMREGERWWTDRTKICTRDASWNRKVQYPAISM